MANPEWKEMAKRMIAGIGGADRLYDEQGLTTSPVSGDDVGVSMEAYDDRHTWPGQEGLEGGIQDSYALNRLEEDMLRYEPDDPRYTGEQSTLMRHTPGREIPPRRGPLQRILSAIGYGASPFGRLPSNIYNSLDSERLQESLGETLDMYKNAPRKLQKKINDWNQGY